MALGASVGLFSSSLLELNVELWSAGCEYGWVGVVSRYVRMTHLSPR